MFGSITLTLSYAIKQYYRPLSDLLVEAYGPQALQDGYIPFLGEL